MTEGNRAAYYDRAESWAQQRDNAHARSARRAWIVAGVAVGVAGLEALAMIAMAPLKTVVPYTLLVDSHTGFTQVLEGTHPQTIRPDAALTQSLLAQYVVAREGYDIATIEEQYRKVALWSAVGARRDYLALMQPGNPQGPIARFGRTKAQRVGVESVSPIGAGRAMVRFYADTPDGGGREYWVAMADYRFSGAPQRMEDRMINPLGFQVTAYRRDQEAAPVPPVTPVKAGPLVAYRAPEMASQPEAVAAPSVPGPLPFRQRRFGPRPYPSQIIQPGGGEP